MRASLGLLLRPRDIFLWRPLRQWRGPFGMQPGLAETPAEAVLTEVHRDPHKRIRRIQPFQQKLPRLRCIAAQTAFAPSAESTHRLSFIRFLFFLEIDNRKVRPSSLSHVVPSTRPPPSIVGWYGRPAPSWRELSTWPQIYPETGCTRVQLHCQ